MKFNSRFGGTRRGGVAFRLFIGIALLSAIPALIIGYFSYSEGSREIIGEKVSDMRQISRLRLGVVSDMVEKLRAYALRFSESRAVAELSGVQAYENFPENLTERLNANGFRAQALEIGLCDSIGGVESAINEAAKLAKIGSYKVVQYPKYDPISEIFPVDSSSAEILGKAPSVFGAKFGKCAAFVEETAKLSRAPLKRRVYMRIFPTFELSGVSGK